LKNGSILGVTKGGKIKGKKRKHSYRGKEGKMSRELSVGGVEKGQLPVDYRHFLEPLSGQ